MIPGRSGGGRTERGAARVGVNVRRGADNDERGVPTDFNYGICAGETLNFPAGTCPPGFHPHPLLPCPSPLRCGSPHAVVSLSTPVVWTCETPRFQFRAISLPPFTSSADHHPPSGWSLFNIDFLSKGQKYREYRVTQAALAIVKPPSFVLHFAESGVRGVQMYTKRSPSRAVLFG